MQQRGDYSSTSAVNSAAKTIVTITAPPAAAASASSLHLGSGRPSSVSTLTLASVPPSLLLEAGLTAAAAGSVSAANTPLAPSGKGHHVSFMPLPLLGMKRIRNSNSSLGSPTAAATTTAAVATAAEVATSSAPSLIEAVEEIAPHAALELRQSVQSQITTLEDVEDSDDSESDSVGVALVETTPQLEYQAGMASSSSSASVK